MVLWLDGGNRLEGETENICVCAKERKGVSAEVLMATVTPFVCSFLMRENRVGGLLRNEKKQKGRARVQQSRCKKEKK